LPSPRCRPTRNTLTFAAHISEMAPRSIVTRAVALALLLVSTLGAEPAHRPLVRKSVKANALAEGAASVPEEEVKQMLAKVMQNPQMQQMAKDPQLVKGLMELMHDPDKMEQLTGDADLSQSLAALVEKDESVVLHLMKQAGFNTGMSLEDMKGASVEEMHAEFVRLAKSDDEHMQRLKKNNDLRDAFATKLGAVVNKVLSDKDRVNKRLNDIKEMGKASKQAVAVSQDGSVKPSLIESLGLKKENVDVLEALASNQQIESALDELAKHMGQKVGSLYTQDGKELEGLQDNAKLRSALKDKLQERIKEQQKELAFAADAESSTFAKA